MATAAIPYAMEKLFLKYKLIYSMGNLGIASLSDRLQHPGGRRVPMMRWAALPFVASYLLSSAPHRTTARATAANSTIFGRPPWTMRLCASPRTLVVTVCRRRMLTGTATASCLGRCGIATWR